MIYLSFLWHMHQPMYEDPRTGHYVLPWVRLHGVKDYYDMVAILDDFPEVRQTFNLSPSLIEQIQGYTHQKKTDPFLEWTRQPAHTLDRETKVTILEKFFMANPSTMIQKHPRYRELWQRRGPDCKDRAALYHIADELSSQDFLDIQVWFTLVWFDPIFQEELQPFFQKGSYFSEEEKHDLLKFQEHVLEKIIPKYVELQDRDQIEVSISPYFHPIVPLIIDTNSAQEALPNINLPRTRFMHPEDARRQIESAILLYEDIFHRPPRGLWSSEGSVSQAMIELIAENNIQWIAADEQILRRSQTQNSFLHQPFRAVAGNNSVNIVFRDHSLSDLIGFTYANWNPQQAAEDFIDRLYMINAMTLDFDQPVLVNVILDGENCWKFYQNDGYDFLQELYGRIANDPQIKTTTISDYLQEYIPRNVISHLFAGSWINHCFESWIGSEEDNMAWEALSVTRKTLALYQAQHPDADPEILKKAWREIYIAEGSDWFWWYGGQNYNEDAPIFDELFRQHLQQVYRLLNKEIPDILHHPIRKDTHFRGSHEPQRLIQPSIDGRETDFYEWRGAGRYSTEAGGTMHATSNRIREIYYGYDQIHLFFRIDFNPNYHVKHPPIYIEFIRPQIRRWQIAPTDEISSEIMAVDSEEMVEVRIDYSALEAALPMQVAFYVVLGNAGKELERHPPHNPIIFTAFRE